MSRMKILRPCRSKKIAKEAQRYSTRTSRVQYHDLDVSKRRRIKIDQASEPGATMI